MEYHLLTPSRWRAYRLLDFGEGYRWEKWGPHTVIRPDGWAVGPAQVARQNWHARHVYQPTGPYQGKWEPPLPEKWTLPYTGEGWRIQLWARAGKFKHLGFFPEQAAHWEWLYAWLRKHPGAQVLNLFAYTGAASVVAALAGAEVTHVDSSRSAITWAAENAQLNGISTIRWLVEDARRFVQRAVRRGKRYEAILLDPPAFGTGTDHRRWVLEEDLPPFLAALRPLLHPEKGLFLLNVYTGAFSPLTLRRLVREWLEPPTVEEVGELALASETGRYLSTGLFVRFTY
ncbi:MAG: oxidoreductase [Bacteroidetes bacterium]|nr:MAG: oxidoreductase [Bacteroidota bacterium]